MSYTTKLTVSLIVHEDFTMIQTALDSLYSNTRTQCRVYVTINAGDPSEVEKLRQKYLAVSFIVNPYPQGFAANHNHILRLAETPYIALLNDDIFIHPQALDTLIAYLEAYPDVGVVGPAIENPDGSQHLSAFSDPSLFRSIYVISGLSSLTRHGGWARTLLQKLGIIQHLGIESLKTDLVTRSVPVIVGVSMVVRREAYLQAGVMDEATIVYGEEICWHWRLRQHDWKVVLVTEARVTHNNVDQVPKGWKLTEQRKGIIHYYVKYRPPWQGMFIRFCVVFFHTLYGLANFIFFPKMAVIHWRTVRMALSWNPED